MLTLAALGLAALRAFSSCGKAGATFFAVRRLLITVASPCGAQAPGTWTSVVVAQGPKSAGSVVHRAPCQAGSP